VRTIKQKLLNRQKKICFQKNVRVVLFRDMTWMLPTANVAGKDLRRNENGTWR
jgi:hypothetical protein